MWGDPIGAATLNQLRSNQEKEPPASSTSAHSCATSLLQVTGPAHIPVADTRWQEFFLNYGILAHLDLNRPTTRKSNKSTPASELEAEHEHENSSSIVWKACKNMSRNARISSNLAAFAVHIIRMLTDLEKSVIQCCQNELKHCVHENGRNNGENIDKIEKDSSAPVSLASQKIALVGKSRVTCGALNIFRILVHEVIVVASSFQDKSSKTKEENVDDTNGAAADTSTSRTDTIEKNRVQENHNCSAEFLKETFSYKSRKRHRGVVHSDHDHEISVGLLSSVLSFICTMGGNQINGKSGKRASTPSTSRNSDYLKGQRNVTNKDISELMRTIPELYDVTVQCLSLLTVLFSTQLYQPMVSSFESEEKQGDDTEIISDKTQEQKQKSSLSGSNFFMNLVMREACQNRKLQRKLQGKEQNIDDVLLYNEANDENSSFSSHSTYKSSGRQSRSKSGASNNEQQHRSSVPQWTSESILGTCLNWLIERPPPPPRSIAGHVAELGQFVAQDIKKGKPGADGMYEVHSIVMARAPRRQREKSSADSRNMISGNGTGLTSPLLGEAGNIVQGRQSVSQTQLSSERNQSTPKIIRYATNKVLDLSSSLLLLPIRLVAIALKLLKHQGGAFLHGNHHYHHGEEEYDHAKMEQLLAAFSRGCGDSSSSVSRTNDVLWLTDSPLADLSNSVFLLLMNNSRANSTMRDNGSHDDGAGDNIDQQFDSNPFRSDFVALEDRRWESSNSDKNYEENNGFVDISLDDQVETLQSINLHSNETDHNTSDGSLLRPRSFSRQSGLFTTNFEDLFEAFGSMLHNEAGSLMLYTVLQSAPSFAASLAVRSDLELLVVPLLRTLYFSSSATHHLSGRTLSAQSNPNGTTEKSAVSAVTVVQRPFRSQSHLYVILILLLIFSQDASFGPDSFRRSNIPVVLWYKERNLKDISLGSLLVLTLLRNITFNLSRLQDPFLLSNCCAVLLNLSPHILNLHSYAAMRLASVAVSSMKRYTTLVSSNGGKQAEEGDITLPIGMHGEVCRTILQVLRHCLRRKVIEHNLHLVYALVYMQRDFKTIVKAKRSPFKCSDVNKIQNVIKEAEILIRAKSARTADQAMDVLQKSSETLKGALSGRVRDKGDSGTTDSMTSDSTMTCLEDFTFTYEEEADPEIFFVPYVWEVIVCAITGSSLEWNKDNIQVFPLLNYVVSEDEVESHSDEQSLSANYAEDVADIV